LNRSTCTYSQNDARTVQLDPSRVVTLEAVRYTNDDERELIAKDISGECDNIGICLFSDVASVVLNVC
jgi:hypothetical protein